MRGRQPDALDAHNLQQTRYFERRVKPTMVPVDSPYLNRQVDEVMRFARLEPGNRVLEVGCGMGRHTLILARRGLRVEGLDLSQVLLDRLRDFDSGRHDIPLYCGDLLKPPPEARGPYDAIVGFFVLHHLATLKGSMVGLSPLLRTGGRLTFVEPNPFNPMYYVQILVTPGMSWQAERGIVHMRRGPVFEAMREAGLVHPTTRRFGFFPPFVVNRAWGRRAEAVLERLRLWNALLPFQLFKGERP